MRTSLYTAATTGRARMLAGVPGLPFGLLDVVLRSERMALLVGAPGLFAALPAMMAATRRRRIVPDGTRPAPGVARMGPQRPTGSRYAFMA